jgi:uncharacterized OB-fold protein
MGENLGNRLLLTECHACGHIQHSTSHTCQDYSSLDMKKAQINGNGKVHSYVLSLSGPHGELSKSPSVFVVVLLDQGPKVLGILVGVGPSPSGIKLDMLVRLAEETTDGAKVLPHFRPI